MPVACYPANEYRIAVMSQARELILWADFALAQQLLREGSVEADRGRKGRGRIRCLIAKPEALPSIPEKPTPIRQSGTTGDSHDKLRQCTCQDCRDNGTPITRHLQRSMNPAGVWSIDFLPRLGKRNEWKTAAIFRRPILEAIYGKAKVDDALSPDITKAA
jgi:hypothetical protein